MQSMKCSDCGSTNFLGNICQGCGWQCQAPAAAVPGASNANSVNNANSANNGSGKANGAGSATAGGSSIRLRSSKLLSIKEQPNRLSQVLGVQGAHPPRRLSVRTRSTQSLLGAGLTNVPVFPPVDIQKLVKSDLVIAAEQRFCANPKCKGLTQNGTPVSLAIADPRKAGAWFDTPHCPKCGSAANFAAIAPGTLINGQYKVYGPIAIGGCGFVYGGYDINVGQAVIIKGLINASDPEAVQGAMAEKQFLANLRDPAMVNIVNFVKTPTGEPCIVMEFVDGTTLSHIRKQNKAPLPVAQAISYILGILPAFSYLHSQTPRVIYCDFKPDNAMAQGDRMRLIDLGGAHIEDSPGSLSLTMGYCSPQQPQGDQPRVTDDIFTIVRTLVDLCLDLDKNKYQFTVPAPQDEPLFAKYESFYRFVLKGTAENPDDRFQNVEELAEQLRLILREIVALDSGTATHVESALFAASPVSDGKELHFSMLPILKLDSDDPAKGLIEAALGLGMADAVKAQGLYEQAVQQFPKSTEAPLRLAESYIHGGDFDKAKKALSACITSDAYDWRNAWLMGKLSLAQGDGKAARELFDAVYSELPGELGAKVALAMAAEMAGDNDAAIRLYDIVTSVGPAEYVVASFGLARCLMAVKDRDNAVVALARVPTVSVAYRDAALYTVRYLIATEQGLPSLTQLSRAAALLSPLPLESEEIALLRATLFRAAIAVANQGNVAAGTSLLDVPCNVAALRLAVAKAYRSCAQLTSDSGRKKEFISQSNAARPFTLI